MQHLRFDMDCMDEQSREALVAIVKKICENRGMVYPDEWGFSKLHDIGIDFALTVDMKD